MTTGHSAAAKPSKSNDRPSALRQQAADNGAIDERKPAPRPARQNQRTGRDRPQQIRATGNESGGRGRPGGGDRGQARRGRCGDRSGGGRANTEALMRIVGGNFRGRHARRARRRRRSGQPRTAYARSIFNILMHAYGDPITGARVLDLFAGTGALGLEALSRGAAFTLFVDDGAEARASIRQNVETLGAAGVTRIFRRDATKLRRRASERAVLADLSRSALWQGCLRRRRCPRRATADG